MTEVEQPIRRRKKTAYGLSIEVKSGARKRSKLHSAGVEKIKHVIGAGGFLGYMLGRAGQAVSGLFNARWVLIMPFAVLLMITATDFLVLTNLDGSSDMLFFNELGTNATDVGREQAELQKTELLQYAYLIILALCGFHWREVTKYFKQWPHLLVLGLVLAYTASYSIEPIKVFTNTLLIAIGYLAAILFAIGHAGNTDFKAFFAAVFFPMLILHVASFLLFIQQDRDLIDLLLSSNRYGGVAGNPNTLGATAVLGYWGALCLLVSRHTTFTIRVVATLALVLFVLDIIMSGSGTSLTTLILITIVIFWLRILAAFKPRTRHVLNTGAAILITLLFITVMILSTPADLFLSFTESLGKDASLTGRTDLWDVARDAIAAKPFLGWGFDSHITVMSDGLYAIPFNHYHNGFLDTLVAGGVVLLLLVSYNLLRFARAFFVAFRKNPAVFPLIVPLILVLFLNLSEYSLLRPNSQIWNIYVVAFVLLTFHQRDRLLSKLTSRGREGSSDSQRGRKRQLRWA